MRGFLLVAVFGAILSSPGVLFAGPGKSIDAPKAMARPKFVKSITFKQGSSKISDLKALERFAGWLRVKTEVTDIRLEGFHCEADRKKDGVKADEMLDYLLFIARERAEAVRAALIARGMEGRRFEIVPLGMGDDPGSCKVTAMALEPEKKPDLKPIGMSGVKPDVKPTLKVSGELGKK